MDFVIEFIADLILILDGILETCKNRKISKYIKYLLTIMIVLFFTVIIGLILFISISMLKDHSDAAGIFMILIGLLMFATSIKKLRI